MLKLQKIILRNFNNVSFAEINLDSPTILLVGDNGCGKSSVVDAIALCLADKKRADTLGQFVKIGATRAEIELFAFIENNPLYFNIKIIKNDSQTTTDRLAKYLDKEYNGSEVSALIKDLELDYYSDIFISMQGGDDITKMTPAVRSSYIQKLLAFSFESQLSKIDEDIKSFNDNIGSLNASISTTQTTIDSLKNQYQDKIIISESDQSTYENTLKNREALQKTIIENTAILRKNAIANNNINKLSNDLISLTEKRNILDNKISSINNAKQLVKDLTEKNDSLNKQIEDLTIDLNTANYLLVLKSKEIESINLEDKTLQDQIYSAEVDARNAIASFDKINQDKCPYCGQSIPESDKSHFEHLKEEAQSTLNKLKEEQTKVTSSLKLFRSEQNDLEVKAKELLGQIKALSTIVSDNKNTINASNQLINDSSDLLKLRDDIAEEIESKKVSIQEEESKIIVIDNDTWAKTQNDLDACENYISKFQKIFETNNSIDITNANIDKNIALNNKIIEDNTKLVTKYGEDLDVRKEAKLIFDKKIPQFIIVKTCTGLENKLNSYVRNIFPNLYVKLLYKKKGVEFVYATNCDVIPDEISEDEMLPIKQASGFEKAVLSLCFKAVLCEAYNLPFCILDEVDAAASDNNSKKLFEIIINGGFFTQSIIISHKPSVIESIKSMAENTYAYTVDNGVFTFAE